MSCPGCKRPLYVDANRIVVCINFRCHYFSPGKHPLTVLDTVNP